LLSANESNLKLIIPFTICCDPSSILDTYFLGTRFVSTRDEMKMGTASKSAMLAILGIYAGTWTAAADCQKDFQTLMDAHRKAGPYRVSSKGGTRPYELDVIAPNKFHIREYDKDGSGALRDEVIFTPTAGWIKQNNKKWEAIPEAAAKQAVTAFNAGLAGGFKNVTELECQGGQAPRELSSGKNVTGYYIFKIEFFDLHSGKQVPTSVGLLQGENGQPTALLLRTKKGDEIQSITYDPKIKIELPMP
jgi:hypothetical protein